MTLYGISWCRGLAGLLVMFLLSPLVAADAPITVYTVNYPLQYFAERIAGKHADVVFPAPDDVDPAFWTPDSETVNRYQQADLILLNGAGYAGWTQHASLPRLKQVDTSAAFSAAYIRQAGGAAHSHGPGPSHSHAGTAFTTWLDFHQAVAQAEAIKQALVAKLPAASAELEANFAALKDDLMQLDLDMQRLIARDSRQLFFASHPVYQYLARRYTLRIQAFEWEPDVMPAEKDWQQLILIKENFPADWIIWETQPGAETVARLQSLNVDVMVFEPCANRPRQGDFLSRMQANINSLRMAYPE